MERAVALAFLVLVMLTAPAAGQDQPGAVPPPSTPQPPDDGFAAKARRYVEDSAWLDRLFGEEDGVYVRFGGMTTGSGIAAGPGYRRHLGQSGILVDVSGALSTKMYKAADVNVRWLQLLGDRLEVWSDFRYQDYPQEDFFGIGLATPLANRTTYDLDGTDIAGRALMHVTPWLEVGADIGFLNPSIASGADDAYPSIETIFTDADAPGLSAQPNFLHTTFYAEFDLRDRRGSPTRGGKYRASYGAWNGVDLEGYDFHRFDVDLSHFVPLYPRHVLGGHVGLSYVNNVTGHRVPFYFLPYIGGSDTVRGFREFRFRDENILFANVEYRYQAHGAVDLALFVDAGEVRADWQDIGFTDLKASYGFGIRVHSERRTFLRLDFGFGGGEGTRFFFKVGPSF